MSSSSTFTRLLAVLTDSLPDAPDPTTVTAETPLDSFGVDSLVLIDLIFDLEQEFGVRLTAEELMSLRTIGDLTRHLDQRLAAS